VGFLIPSHIIWDIIQVQ